jgi:hypothetical protein
MTVMKLLRLSTISLTASMGIVVAQANGLSGSYFKTYCWPFPAGLQRRKLSAVADVEKDFYLSHKGYGGVGIWFTAANISANVKELFCCLGAKVTALETATWLVMWHIKHHMPTSSVSDLVG